jgi:uncharacterized C2H2 Zn-finger protein
MAERKSFKCPKCDRTFRMAPHLGRHMATTHGSRLKRGGAPRAARTQSRAAARGPAGLLGDVHTWRAELAARQAELETQVAALDQLLAVLAGAAPRAAATPGPRGRSRGPVRQGSLKSFVVRVLHAARRPMRRIEIADAVLKAGYKSRDKTFAKSVGVVLRTVPGVKKLGRGVYQAT